MVKKGEENKINSIKGIDTDRREALKREYIT